MKYLKFLLLFVAITMLCMVSNVYAQSDSFYEGEAIEGAYLKKFKPGATTGKYEQMRIFRRSSDHQAAYCIELWTDLVLDQEVTGYVTKYAERAGITEEEWQRIQLIAYYGYEYEEHTTPNWYAASQFLIWKTLEPRSTFYFTDTLNGNAVSKFRDEMEEIESLIERHSILPSFVNQTYTAPCRKNTQLVDTNDVLELFNVIPSDSLMVARYRNTLGIIPEEVGTFSIQLTKEDTTRKTMLYVSPSSQNLIVRGNYPKIKAELKIKAEAGKLVFQKVDKDTGKPLPQGDASFVGTTYELYDEEHRYIQSIQFVDYQPITVDMLPYGTYYVKETKSGEGYQLNPKEYTIQLNTSSMTIELEDEVYKSKVLLQKYYGVSETLKEEIDAEFEIYNSTHELVSKIKTNLHGQAEIELPYGTYTFHQVRGKDGYLFVDDFTIQITDSTPKEIRYSIKNNPIERYLKVIKKDLETGKNIIVGNATFRIKNLDTGEYVKQKLSYPNGEMIDVFSTNEQGFFITPEPLPYGHYQLEEISSPVGYYPLKEAVLFEISEEVSSITDPNYGPVIFIEVYNQPKVGTLTVHKWGEIFQIDQGVFDYSYHPLENISFSIYAEEDIILGDGTTLYEKGDLVIKKDTDSDGIINVSLPLGKYSVVETTFLEQYIRNEKKYFVEITGDSLDTELNIYNYLKKGSLVIYKKDAITNDPISDTYFSIYTDSFELIATIVTDESGVAFLDSLPLGLYYIEEVHSNLNYSLDSTRYTVQIEEGEQVVSLDIFNNPILPPKTSVDPKPVKRFLFFECLLEISFAFFLVSFKPFQKKLNCSKNMGNS